MQELGAGGNLNDVGAKLPRAAAPLGIATGKLAHQDGATGFAKPVKVSCLDHETGGAVMIQQWDGHQWTFVSDWIKPMREVVRPLVEKAAADYAKENNLEMRDCK